MQINFQNLQIAMANACMNKGELAEAAGISRISIGKYFSGKRNPSTKTIGKIAKALDVPVTDIIEE
ncbi:MAG: helix-turn-helix transcriptional regulator [Ruminococcus sp.]|nr:helix-turn-helix transcriptional regulator [Ruminococcus sp.]